MNSKRKGADGERELARKLRELGFENARRGVQYQGGQDSPDVVGIDGFHIECKRVEKLNIEDAMQQSERDAGTNVPLVIHRKDKERWKVTLRLEDFVDLIRSGR